MACKKQLERLMNRKGLVGRYGTVYAIKGTVEVTNEERNTVGSYGTAGYNKEQGAAIKERDGQVRNTEGLSRNSRDTKQK